MKSRYLVIFALLASTNLLCATSSLALDNTQLRIGELQGDGWRAQQLQISLQLGATPVRAQIKANRATLQGLQQPLRDLVIDCADVQLQADHFSCAKARISGNFPYLGQQRFTGSASYARNSGAIAIGLNGVAVAKGLAKLQAQFDVAGWQGQIELHDADLAGLLKLAEQFSLKKGISGSGGITARINARGVEALPQQINWQVQTQKASLNNSDGTLATSELALHSIGSATARPGGWQFDVQLGADAGQAYAEPVFVDFTKYALQLDSQGQWDGGTRVQLQRLRVDQQHVVTATAQGELQLDAKNPVPNLSLQLARLEFPGSFASYAQPFLLDTSFKNLNTSGVVHGEVQVRDTLPVSIDLQLLALHADDGGNNLRLDQVHGDFHWLNVLADNSAPPRSTISWQSGRLLGLELGATQLPLEIWSTNLRVAGPSRIPIFNGALAIDAFRVRKLGTPQMAFMLDAVIEPINVAKISQAFGWPEFGGELSGKITKLRMENDVLTLGASLNAQVFGGEVGISNMRLEGALSNWPRFNADIAIHNLNLEQVTQAFSFGKITGRLSGEIDDLSLFNWQPVSFDARLYTPEDDHSKHRISQRAVQNIGSIGGSGGGVAAALQSGLLRFFEDFNYDKLGVSCRLADDVCLMNGIAAAKGGNYYLVKGRGLPRIDVIGTGTRVDWPRLVAQLKAATESPGPVVK